MLEKFLIFRDVDSGNLTIEERAVIDPIPRGSDTSRLSDDVFCLVYSKTYSGDKIESAIENGKSSLIDTIRTRNFFPIKKHCEAIAEAIIRIFNDDENSAELFFDAKEPFAQAQEK